MVGTTELKDGMKVRTMDGHDLGKIIRLDSGILVIEKGFFFPKDYEVPVSMVSEIRDGEALLSVSKEAFEREGSMAGGTGLPDEGARDESARGTGLGAAGAGLAGAGLARAGDDGRETGWTAGSTGDTGRTSTEQTRVQLAEEELQATTRSRDAGEVRVTKEIVTEHKTLDVPVTREEVHVERVPVSASSASNPVGSDAFDEKTIVVPVHEEEIEITKRPRVREEVRVSKTSRTVEQRAEADVRREEARIERTDDEGDGGRLARSDDEGRGGMLAGSEDEATRTAGYGTPEKDRDERGGGLLGLGRDDER